MILGLFDEQKLLNSIYFKYKYFVTLYKLHIKLISIYIF